MQTRGKTTPSASAALATFTALLVVLTLASATFGASASTPPLYVGVPQNASATYFQKLTYVVSVNNTPLERGGFNNTFTLAAEPYSSVNGVVLTFPFKVDISNVEVSKNYSSTIAGKNPPTPTVLIGSEYTNNYSIPPYYIISPNAPTRSYSSTQLGTPYFNISVVRLPNFSYKYGNVSFDGSAIEQVSVYQPPSTSQGQLITKNVYFYDAQSGLLMYWTNTTLYLLPKNSVVNVTSTVNLVETNLASINPGGDATPVTPTLPTATASSPFSSPVFIVLIVVVVALVIVVILAFARRRPI